MYRTKLWSLVGLIVVASMLLAACSPAAAPTAEIVEVEVTREVVVEGETRVETETIIVTATPAPPEEVAFESADPNTLFYAAFSEGIETLDPAWNYESEGLSTMIY